LGSYLHTRAREKNRVNIFNFFRKKTQKGMSQFDAFDKPTIINGTPVLASPEQYLNAYNTINYISTMAGILSSDIASLEYFLLNKKGEIVNNLEFEQLIEQPNDNLTGFELRQISMLHFLLEGNFFWLPEQGDALALMNNKPSRISVLNPSEIDIVSNGTIIKAKDISSYNTISHYQATGTLLQTLNNRMLNKDSIIHIKGSSPYNAIRGMGKIQANAPMLEIDMYQNIFNKAFFRQGAMSNLAAMQKEDLGPQQYEMWKKAIDIQYQGLSNMHKIIKLPPNTDVKPLNLSHKDMDFLSQKEMTRQDVANIFELPPVISGDLNKVQGYSSTQQMKRYFKNTLPKYSKQLAYAYQNILNRFDKSLTFKFKYPVAIDRNEESEVGQRLFDRGAISQNEYREMLGLPTVEDQEANNRYIKTDYINVETLDELNASNLIQTTEKEFKKTYISKALENFNQDNFIRFSKRTREKIANKIAKDIASFYKKQESRVQTGLKKAANIKDLYNVSVETKELEKTAKKMFTSALSISYNELNEYFDIEFDATTKNPVFNKQVATLTDKIVEQITPSRKEELERLLNVMVDEGLSLSELSSQIEDLYGTLDSTSGSRAMRIARTEASKTWDTATIQSYKELDVKVVDVVGCDDEVPDCNKKNVPIEEASQLTFHPNHTGTIVPRS